MLKSPLACGDVVQIDPDIPTFGGCFLIVTKTMRWGCDGVAICAREDGEVEHIRLRPTWDKIEFVGRAVWYPPEEDVIDDADEEEYE